MSEHDTNPNATADSDNNSAEDKASAALNINQVSDAELDSFIMQAQSSNPGEGADDEDNGESHNDDGDEEGLNDFGSEDDNADADADDAAEDDQDVDADDLDSDEENDEEEEDDGEINYEASYKELFAPIKANGREVTINSVEEARRLIQQGLGYNKNMQEFKPYKKAMNLLKHRKALDPEKLNFLLDVAEGKPEALAKLLKDQEINPLDIDMEGKEYESTYRDTEALDTFNEVLDSLEVGEAKVQTLEILSSGGWDKQSKEVLYADPQNILRLHRQIQDGSYGKIMGEVVKRQALGDLIGVSDLEAYNIVGTELTKQGKLGVPNTPNGSTKSGRPNKQLNQAQKQKRKKASGAPRQAASNQPKAEMFNPATATEAELDAFIQSHLKKAASN